MNNKKPRSFNKSKNSNSPKTGKSSQRPFFNTKLKGKSGAQQGDYIIISDGKKKVTTRINLPSHPFAKKEVGEMVTIKGVEWYLIKILHQGTAAYKRVYDEDTQREHYGY